MGNQANPTLLQQLVLKATLSSQLTVFALKDSLVLRASQPFSDQLHAHQHILALKERNQRLPVCFAKAYSFKMLRMPSELIVQSYIEWEGSSIREQMAERRETKSYFTEDSVWRLVELLLQFIDSAGHLLPIPNISTKTILTTFKIVDSAIAPSCRYLNSSIPSSQQLLHTLLEMLSLNTIDQLNKAVFEREFKLIQEKYTQGLSSFVKGLALGKILRELLKEHKQRKLQKQLSESNQIPITQSLSCQTMPFKQTLQQIKPKSNVSLPKSSLQISDIKLHRSLEPKNSPQINNLIVPTVKKQPTKFHQKAKAYLLSNYNQRPYKPSSNNQSSKHTFSSATAMYGVKTVKNVQRTNPSSITNFIPHPYFNTLFTMKQVKPDKGFKQKENFQRDLKNFQSATAINEDGTPNGLKLYVKSGVSQIGLNIIPEEQQRVEDRR